MVDNFEVRKVTLRRRPLGHVCPQVIDLLAGVAGCPALNQNGGFTMIRFAVLAIWVAACISAHAQSREETFLEVGKRLDAIEKLTVSQANMSANASGIFTSTFEQVQSVVAYLQNNPYMRVKGFKVTVGMPPRVEIEFDTTIQKDKLPFTDPAARSSTRDKK
jgi:hypothetical protein